MIINCVPGQGNLGAGLILCLLEFILAFGKAGFTMQNFIFKPFPKQALVFTCLQYKSIENTVGKGEIARNEDNLDNFLSFS